MNVIDQDFTPSAIARDPGSDWLPIYFRAVWVVFLVFSTFDLRAQTPANTAAVNAGSSNDMYLAGVALAKDGQLDQAITMFNKALEGDAQNPSLLDAIGAAYSFKGNFEQAERYFLKCIQADPEFLSAHKNLAITYFNMQQYDLAAVEFQKVLTSSPASNAVPNLFLGIIAEKKSSHAEAARLLNASGPLLNRYPEAILSLAQAELELKQVRKAQDTLLRFDKSPGITAAQYLSAANLKSRAGQNQEALQELDKARDKGADARQVAYQRALLLDGMNRSAEALRILNHLAATSPDSNTLNLLAHVAERSGDLALAMQSLRRAAKIDPAREDNYLDFSTICTDYENYPVALEAAEIGLEHIPGSYRLSVQKGVVLEHLGRFDDAENALRNAAQMQKDNSEALLSLAIVQTHAGQLQNAESTLTSAVSRFPDNYYMHYQLGKVFLQLQEANSTDVDLRAGAKREFEQAIRCNPSFADSYYQLSKLCLRDSAKAAEQDLVKCLQLDPNHAPAEYTLARLYLSSGRRAAGQALIDRFESQRQAEKSKENQKPRIELAQK